MKVLTETQCEKFAEVGYLIIDFKFSKLLLDEIVTHVSYLYRKQPCSEFGAPRRVQDAWKSVNAVREVAVSSAVLSALKQLFGREPLPFQTLNFPVGTRQRSHSDTIHFNSIPRGSWPAFGSHWKTLIERMVPYSIIREVINCLSIQCKILI